MDPISQWIVRLGWYLAAWLFALGAAAGSFLNVVVYRVPAGKSLVWPGSHCPACGHPIRWYHNLPIVSWVWLGGKCRDCGAPISPRYPLVELGTALLFVGLAAVEIWPAMAPDPNVGIRHVFTAPDAPILPGVQAPLLGGELLARYAYHLWLLCTLLAAALIERDGNTAPRRMFWLAAVAGLIGAAACPAVQPYWSRVLPAPWNIGPRWSGLAESVAGGAAGLLVGGLFALIAKAPAKSSMGAPAQLPDQRDREPAKPQAAALAAIGAFLGWHGVVLIAIASTLVWLLVISRPTPRPERGRRKSRKIALEPPRWGWSAAALLITASWFVMASQMFEKLTPRLP